MMIDSFLSFVSGASTSKNCVQYNITFESILLIIYIFFIPLSTNRTKEKKLTHFLYTGFKWQL